MVAALLGGAGAFAATAGSDNPQGQVSASRMLQQGEIEPNLALLDPGTDPRPTPDPDESARGTQPSGPSSASRGVKARSAAPPAVTPALVPRQVRVRSVGLRVDVVPVGIDRQGLMSVPESLTRFGWYRYGPDAGSDTGAMVLAGHIDSREQGVGPAARLRQVQVGDTVTVLAGRKTIRYEVTSVRSIDKDRISLESLFSREGAARLHLVTCTGSFDSSERSYRANLVVTATRKSV